jgi:hypothetical protein
MAVHEIKTPRGRVFHSKDGTAILEFNTNFKNKWLKKFGSAQSFVDIEVLRLSAPYIPKETGMLIKSGSLGTNIGSGTVRYIAPYARRQYYLKNRKPQLKNDHLRGSLWFKRMKEAHGEKILRGARHIMRTEGR